LTDFIPSLNPLVFTDINNPSVNTEGITIEIKGILKNQKVQLCVFFMDDFTDGTTVGLKQGMPHSDVSLVLTKLPMDWQIKTFCR